MDQITSTIQYYRTDFLDFLQQVMQIPSVKDTPVKGAPYGKEIRRVLDLVMAQSAAFGFQTKIIDDVIGYAQWGNDNQNYIAVLGHLDVVPAGSGWDYSPYDLTEEDGCFYGRGILDNKGPIISCLYGMKLLKDMGYRPNKTVRLIFGTDEESGMSDICHYLEAEHPPVFCFTPDCKYPVVYGERGIVNVVIHMPLLEKELYQVGMFQGDQFRDHVPDQLSVKINDKIIEVVGKRAPSNAPDMGNNAITLLAGKLIKQSNISQTLKSYFYWIYESFHNKHYGEGINLAFSDKDSGKLILAPVVLSKTNKGLDLEVAFRYPVSVNEETVLENLKKNIPKAAEIKVVRSIPSICHSKNSSEINKLSQIYAEITGNSSEPVTTTGATYARKMPNTIAFGPSFPGQKGIAHNKNEYMDAEDLFMNLEIYTRSIKALME